MGEVVDISTNKKQSYKKKAQHHLIKMHSTLYMINLDSRHIIESFGSLILERNG